jgi:hypothetical protein
VNPTVFLKLGAGLINRTEGVVGNQQLEIDHELNVNLYRTKTAYIVSPYKNLF